ncbi:MAG: hypothetical protein J1F32_03570 [Erysipelotrichales bacterium]|nr:hypothetical protein [Erysipelotrichales bacterium]
MEKKQKSKKTVYLITVIACILMVMSIAILPICNVLKESGYGDFWWPLVGLIGFFSLMIIALILLIYIFKDSIYIGVEKQLNKYSKLPLCKIENVNLTSLKQKLEEEFELVDAFYRKKEFSLSKDRICYLVAFTSLTDFEKDIDDICLKLDGLNEKCSNIAAIVILTKSKVEEEDYKKLKEFGRNLYVSETIMPASAYKSLIPMIYDFDKECLSYFNSTRKMDISNYNHACKKINKICKKIQSQK